MPRAGYKKIRHIGTQEKSILCLSHLRWNFVFQRPQHILSRASHQFNIIFFEEPIFEAIQRPELRISEVNRKLRIYAPVLPQGTRVEDARSIQRGYIDQILAISAPSFLVRWYYTPMALLFTNHLEDDVCVYDCMDELSAFKNAPSELVRLERELFSQADIVFTGGQSLFEAKRAHHPSVHAFPSSIDAQHFHRARQEVQDPADQADIPHPRVGYFGVIDERLDIDLVRATAAMMPDVHFVMIGPVVKIDAAALPQAPNLHWLGAKSYADLPSYLAHWDAGWMPFALNESTRYISPTKTPEFLAAGLPVISTAIVDVVRSYGACGLVDIVDQNDISPTLRAVLARPRDCLREKVDACLSGMSWDLTWEAMAGLIRKTAALKVVPLRRGA